MKFMKFQPIRLLIVMFLFHFSMQSAECGTISCNGRIWTTDKVNDHAEMQAALDAVESGGTITIGTGEYYISQRLHQKGKSLHIKGEGTVTFHMHTPVGIDNGLSLEGSHVKTVALCDNAAKGCSTVVLSDASGIRQGDLIKIWKNVAWCPLDYPDQKTGEMYEIKNAIGDTVTLTESLLRDYPASNEPRAMIYRPIEVHIDNIRIEGGGATTQHGAIVLKVCKNSSVKNCFVRNSGLSAISFYSCFRMNAQHNEIHDSLLPGSGYGIAIWSGSAHVNVANNLIENCRHCITGNTNERLTLIRDITISNNNLVGGSITGANVIDAHAITLDYAVTKNKIWAKADFFAFIDGSFQSEFSENKIHGGCGAVVRRGNVGGGSHIIKGNDIEGEAAYTYRGYGGGAGDTLVVENNIQKGGSYGVRFSSDQPESFKTIIIRGNRFAGLSNHGIYHQYSRDGANIEATGNTFEDIAGVGINIEANSRKMGKIIIHGNRFKNVDAEIKLNGVSVSEDGIY